MKIIISYLLGILNKYKTRREEIKYIERRGASERRDEAADHAASGDCR